MKYIFNKDKDLTVLVNLCFQIIIFLHILNIKYIIILYVYV